MAKVIKLYLQEQQSQCSPKPQAAQKHPLLGLWNPIWQGWLANGVEEVSNDSDIWTPDFNAAQAFRTATAAENARKHLRDFYDVTTSICVLDFA